MRIIVDALLRRRDAHATQHLDRRAPRRAAVEPAVAHEDLHDLLADRVARIERGHRLLEVHGEAVAAQVASQLSWESASGASMSLKPIWPVTLDVRFGRSPITARNVTLLPEPDSPTTPSVRPRATASDNPVRPPA